MLEKEQDEVEEIFEERFCKRMRTRYKKYLVCWKYDNLGDKTCSLGDRMITSDHIILLNK